MGISGTASTTSAIRTLEDFTAEKTKTDNNLGKADFLQLLVAQLSNQDPMESSSDTEFISQLAQFSLLEEIQTMSSALETSQAYSLIGKVIYIEGDSDTDVIFGKVDGVVKKDGIDYLLVGEEAYELSDVTGVLDGSALGATDEEILNSSNLIGKTVTASYVDETTGETALISGEVEKITINDGAIYILVGGNTLPISNVQEIVE